MRAAVRDLGRRRSPGTVAPYRGREGVLWRLLFVPLYRRLPWRAQAARDGRAADDGAGWQPPERRPREPWRPPRPS